MNQLKRETIGLLLLVSLFASAYSSVTYRVISTGPNSTKGEVIINEQSLFWTLVLRFDNAVKLRVTSGGTILSSSPEKRIFIIAGNSGPSGEKLAVIFESKYDKKSPAKLINATYNGRPLKVK